MILTFTRQIQMKIRLDEYDLCFKRATVTGTLFDKDLFHLCVQVQLVDVDSLVPGNGKMVMMF